LDELDEARQYAASLGIRHIIVPSNELDAPGFRENSPRRCYYCKRELFGQLVELARQEGVEWVADGTNGDDTNDYRPGMEAARELGVRSPLKEAGLGKEDIRVISRQMDLPTWDKPSLACYASRFPYGSEISEDNLKQVAGAETFLRRRGIRTVRVRHYGHIARIEAGLEEMSRFLDEEFRLEVVSELKDLGFLYVTLDLEGFRSGSMNAVLDLQKDA
jgi:uncharacterized protein